VLDDRGTLVPDAGNLVRFSIAGKGKLAAVDNGLQTSMESFQASERRAFNGLCLAVVQSKEQAGAITLKAQSDGLKEASIVITAK
jgi:beta-galactosidase